MKSVLSIAILPLLNRTGDPSLDYLSDGIAEDLARNLGPIARLGVIAFSSTSVFRGKEVEPRALAREVGAKAVLSGSLSESGDKLSIQVVLDQGREGSRLWQHEYRRAAADLLSLQRELIGAISRELKVNLSPEDAKAIDQRCNGSGEAYRLYLAGRSFWNIGTELGLKQSLECFNQALDEDPNYAQAYAGVAQAYDGLSGVFLPPEEAVPQVKAAAIRALEIQPSLSDAYLSLAVLKCQYEWDWSGAEADFQRCLELNPNCASARRWYGMYLVETGRPAEATHELELAQRLDPLSASVAVTAVWPLIKTVPSLRQYQTAIQELLKICAVHSRYVPALQLLAACYEDLQRYQEASSTLSEALSLEPDNPELLSRLASVQARAGASQSARQNLAQLAARSATQHIPAFHLAVVHVALGEKDQAFGCLERAYQERDQMLATLKVDPALDDLRLDSRFSDLLFRVGLRPEKGAQDCERPAGPLP